MSGGLQLTALAAAYGARQVLRGVDSSLLPRGEVCALLGPNGGGKSTLLKALAGLTAAAGSARLDGGELLSLPLAARARQVVYLPQNLPPALHLRVYESVLVAGNAERLGLANRQQAEAVEALLARLGLAELAMRYLDELSGGQRQLVGLAQALIREPALLLLDEPLSALDLAHQYQVMRLVREETARRRMVTLLVLHDVNIALQHCQRAMLLQGGRLLACGQPGEVITPAALAAVYGVAARVEPCSQGRLTVQIDGVCA